MLLLILAVNVKIADYTDSNYIPIRDGNAIIWQEFNYLAHSSNLTMLSEMAEETDGLSVYFPVSHMKMLLKSDVARIKALLATLNVHHRHSKSINFFGHRT